MPKNNKYVNNTIPASDLKQSLDKWLKGELNFHPTRGYSDERVYNNVIFSKNIKRWYGCAWNVTDTQEIVRHSSLHCPYINLKLTINLESDDNGYCDICIPELAPFRKPKLLCCSHRCVCKLRDSLIGVTENSDSSSSDEDSVCEHKRVCDGPVKQKPREHILHILYGFQGSFINRLEFQRCYWSCDPGRELLCYCLSDDRDLVVNTVKKSLKCGKRDKTPLDVVLPTVILSNTQISITDNNSEFPALLPPSPCHPHLECCQHQDCLLYTLKSDKELEAAQQSNSHPNLHNPPPFNIESTDLSFPALSAWTVPPGASIKKVTCVPTHY